MARFITSNDIAKGVNWLEEWPLITAGTGCGKTHFMVHDLPQLVQERTGKEVNSVLLLEPLNMLKNDVLKNYKGLTEEIFPWELADKTKRDALQVMCFSPVGSFLSDGNEIQRHFDLVLLDEIDQLARWSICHEGNLLVWDWLQEQKKQGSIVCGATATPGLLLDYVNKEGKLHFVDATPDFPVNLKSNNVTVVPSIKAQTFLKAVKPGPQNKYLVYCQSATRCEEMAKDFSDHGAGFIISKYQEKENKDGKKLCEVMDDQMYPICKVDDGFGEVTLREYITEYQVLPESMNVLIINDAAVCGINIHDPLVKHVIAETVNLDTAKQARGRIRHDLESFNVVFTKYKHEEEDPIETYKVGDEAKLNPFSDAIKKYNQFWHDNMGNSEESKEFIRENLAHETDNPITFLDAEEVRQNANNSEVMSKLDVFAIFNFQEGETEKYILSKELTALAKKYPMQKKNRNKAGKNIWIDTINKSGLVKIDNLGQCRINGLKKTWYKVSKCR